MTCLIVLAAIQLFGICGNEGTAVYAGPQRRGLKISAEFTVRRIADDADAADRRESLAGIRALVVNDSVASLPDGLCAGAPDLESVTIGYGVTNIGARAFADCSRLACVSFRRRSSVTIHPSAFVGAAKNLTAVDLGSCENKGGKVTCPGKPWDCVAECSEADVCWQKDKKSAARPEKSPLSLLGDVLFVSTNRSLYARRADGRTRLVRILSTDDPAVVPGGADGKAFDEFNKMAVPLNSEATGLVIEGTSEATLFRMDRERFKVIFCPNAPVRYPYRDARSGNYRVYTGVSHYDNLSDGVLPPWVDYSQLKALTNGIPTDEGYRYLVRDGHSAAIVGSDGESAKQRVRAKVIAVPKMLGGFPVTQLPDSFFAGCFSLERLELPPTLTEIPEGLCFGCPELKVVTGPTNLLSVGRCAFRGCPQLAQSFVGAETQVARWAFDDPVLPQVPPPPTPEEIADRIAASNAMVHAMEKFAGFDAIAPMGFRIGADVSTVAAPLQFCYEGCNGSPRREVYYVITSQAKIKEIRGFKADEIHAPVATRKFSKIVVRTTESWPGGERGAEEAKKDIRGLKELITRQLGVAPSPHWEEGAEWRVNGVLYELHTTTIAGKGSQLRYSIFDLNLYPKGSMGW